MIRLVLALSSVLVLCACADNPAMEQFQARNASIDRILGPYDSTTRNRQFPQDPDRSIRTADCRQPVAPEGANLLCE